jgi:hydrogenase expression/formation protein HypC
MNDGPTGMPMGKVSFGGIVREVCLAYVPGVTLDSYVIVHAGFAISQINEAEALEVFEYLRQIGELEELETPQPE